MYIVKLSCGPATRVQANRPAAKSSPANGSPANRPPAIRSPAKSPPANGPPLAANRPPGEWAPANRPPLAANSPPTIMRKRSRSIDIKSYLYRVTTLLYYATVDCRRYVND